MLTGCSLDLDEVRTIINGSGNVKQEDLADSNEKRDVEDSTIEDEKEQPQTKISEAEIADAMNYQTDNFAYESLEEEEHKLYIEIYTVLNNMNQDITISSLNVDDVDRIFQYVMDDHPELYFVEGYSITKYTTNGVVSYLTLSGKYTKTKEQRELIDPQIENYVVQCFLNLPMDGDEYKKAKYIYEYLINHTEYDINSTDNQNICSVFLNGRSVCQGYAKATQYLLKRAGIFATLLSGTVKNGEGHAWNLAYIDGNWCYLDTTWGDASYQSEVSEETLNGINYDYLGANEEVLSKTHHVNTTLELPLCHSLNSYYFVREGKYFTEYDEDKVVELFKKSYEKDETVLTIKCDSKEVYDAILADLIDNERIFRLIEDGTRVKYVRMEENLTLMFYL